MKWVQASIVRIEACFLLFEMIIEKRGWKLEKKKKIYIFRSRYSVDWLEKTKKDELYIKNKIIRQFEQVMIKERIDLLYFLSNYVLTLRAHHANIHKLTRERIQMKRKWERKLILNTWKKFLKKMKKVVDNWVKKW